MSGLLKMWGCKQIATAIDLAGARNVMENFPPDFIVCSYNVEPLNGGAFTRALRAGQLGGASTIPVIMLLDRRHLGQVDELRDAGGDKFLLEPVKTPDLLSVLIRILKVAGKPASAGSAVFHGQAPRSQSWNEGRTRSGSIDHGPLRAGRKKPEETEYTDIGPAMSQTKLLRRVRKEFGPEQ